MKQPVIGLTLSKTKLAGNPENFITTDYAQAIIMAGGIPRLIPNNSTDEELEEFRGMCDGILLSGGGDIHPKFYGEQKRTETGNINTARDQVELKLISMALASNWPILGICRGHQMLNVALGGTLIQDIPAESPSEIQHQAEGIFPAHMIIPESGSKLSQILKQNCIQVNSRHHQAIQKLAANLRVTARASDGLIEGIELPEHRFFIGVQWHPENLCQEYEEHLFIFQSLIAAARG